MLACDACKIYTYVVPSELRNCIINPNAFDRIDYPLFVVCQLCVACITLRMSRTGYSVSPSRARSQLWPVSFVWFAKLGSCLCLFFFCFLLITFIANLFCPLHFVDINFADRHELRHTVKRFFYAPVQSRLIDPNANRCTRSLYRSMGFWTSSTS